MRIAIVNALAPAVEALRRVITGVPDYDIAWVARHGAEAVAKCALDCPDVVLMDVSMPVMDGVEATRRIVLRSSCVVLVVTTTVASQAGAVFAAMRYGALDAVNTPVLDRQGRLEGGAALLAKIATIKKLLATRSSVLSPRLAAFPGRPLVRPAPPLVVIGASTGGPRALATVLSCLPAQFPAAMVIVQHVDALFAPGLTAWLNAQTPLTVRLAREGCRPEVGTVWLAGSNDHLVMTAQRTLSYTPEPRHAPYCPSIDVFFHSVARHWPDRAGGVLLSGMGRDGAVGLAALRRAGWYTIAQDEASSEVYGMPKAAVELGAATHVLPVAEIAPSLRGFFARNRGV